MTRHQTLVKTNQNDKRVTYQDIETGQDRHRIQCPE